MEIYVVEYNACLPQFDGIQEENCLFSTFEKAKQWVEKKQNEMSTNFNFEVISNYYDKDNDEYFYSSTASLNKNFGFDNIWAFDITIYKAIVDENA